MAVTLPVNGTTACSRLRHCHALQPHTHRHEGNTQMLVIAGYLLLAPTERDRFVAQHLDLVARARQAPGCLDLAISSDPVNDARVNTFERWENEESLAAWREIANSPQLDIEFLGGDMAKYHIDKTSPVF